MGRSVTEETTKLYDELELGKDARERLAALLDEPTPERWGDAYTVILGPPDGPTLWQALAVVDPWHTPSAEPGLPDDPDEWVWAPQVRAVRAALRWAVERKTEKEEDG